SSQTASVAARWAERLLAFCGERTEDGAGFPLDARLRPYGSSGALASPLEALREYFESENSGFAAWERQALTRARFAAGDGEAGARAMALARGAAFPDVWRASWSDELKHIKKRVEKERGAKGEVFDLKMGRGALADIEWAAQWLAMKHGARFPAMQTPSTRGQLGAARDAELLSESEWKSLDEAYTWLRRAELRLQIAQEGGATTARRGSVQAALWARAAFPGLENGAATARFESEWTMHTARAREVFERVRDEL
ncbi:MAG: hypothetical protein KY445_15855, partial [Armatimonadetes bacterium]|nr:hypothetical protein [Armatimonadota bacterium]